ncbi:MAG TPA: sugar ABC transporter permease [bacterium]|nr:sugar ABC transporter permease [bacterium]
MTATGRTRRWGVSPAVWLLGPALAFVVLLTGFPFLYAIYLSLNRFLFGNSPRFIGLGNYAEMLRDPLFWTGLRVTFVLYLASLAAQLALGLYVGMLLNRPIRAARLLRTLLLSPFAMPSVAVGMMWLILLDPSFGSVNYLLQLAGLPKSLFLASPSLAVPTLAAIDTWQWTPFVALIILGGLQSLPQDPYEAAVMDGASPLQLFRFVTLPLLRPALLAAAILRSVDLLRFFDTIYITTQGGPGNASTTLNIYAYQQGFQFFELGYASALMLTLLAAVLLVVTALARVRRAIA